MVPPIPLTVLAVSTPTVLIPLLLSSLGLISVALIFLSLVERALALTHTTLPSTEWLTPRHTYTSVSSLGLNLKFSASLKYLGNIR